MVGEKRKKGGRSAASPLFGLPSPLPLSFLFRAIAYLEASVLKIPRSEQILTIYPLVKIDSNHLEL